MSCLIIIKNRISFQSIKPKKFNLFSIYTRSCFCSISLINRMKTNEIGEIVWKMYRTFTSKQPFEYLLNFILEFFSFWNIKISFSNFFYLKMNSLHKSKHLQPWAPISCLTMNHQSHFQGVGYQKKREVFISKYLFFCFWWVKDIKL